MKLGLYEEIVNTILSQKLENVSCSPVFEKLEVVDSHDYLAQYLYRVLAQGLAQVKSEQGLEKDSDKLKSRLNQQVSICNEIIQVLKNRNIDGIESYNISEKAQRLIAILEDAIDKKASAPVRPDTPLALGALLTGTRQDPSFISQIKKEIFSADKIDMLVSFIKWSGVMLMKDQLENFTKATDKKLRIITTSYMGATDLKAIKWLESLPNTEVKISYDTHRTRLHAKAFSFYRETGFSSAYVGSANISQAAFTDGLEWTVKISQYEQPYQWKKITATFDTYWNDSEFEVFQAKDEVRLKAALSAERSSQTEEFVLPNFDLKPYGFQKEILDQIQVERQLQQKNKHLIVAATGTGKTMIAAFDFKQWRVDFKNSNQGSEPKLLFVAHRKEILKQSLMTFRSVLKDQNYGDLLVDGNQPEQLDQLFISIQSYNSKELSDAVDAHHYNYIVVDEFHHAAAKSYQVLLDHVEPDSLLGLTATPERADGKEITLYFDGHITAEIRLPDAINRKLLCPFHYYGISDSADFSALKWSRGGYVSSEISNLLTGDDKRAQLILEKTAEVVLDIKQVRGLGFCVSKKHAEFMCRKFNEANIPSEFLTSDTNSQDRNSVRSRLINKEINFIFVVDIYNEGVDIPEIDTVLFLRPTESLTVFLQQLGRGLRLNDDKDCLTVLDFVGQSHKNFRYDLRLNALNTNSKSRIDEELSDDFPHLPAGCSIQLERKAKERILQNIQESFFKNKPRIIQHIQSFVSDTGLKLTLDNFLTYYRMSPDEIYKRGTWSRLCVLAGEEKDFSDPDEEQLTKGFRRLLHINDDIFIDHILAWLEKPFKEDSLSNNDIKRLTMLHFTLWNNSFNAVSVTESFEKLDDNPTLKEELKILLQLCKSGIVSLPETISLPFDTPLRLHGRYTLNEILVGLGRNTLENQPAMREGVLHLKEINTDAFFITINKSEKHYSTTTLYDDYAISDKLFHWQSQSNTSVESPTGKRYIEHLHTILLFVREERALKGGLAEPYYFIGPATYVSHEGSRPIGFVWELVNPMPAHLVREAAHLSIS